MTVHDTCLSFTCCNLCLVWCQTLQVSYVVGRGSYALFADTGGEVVYFLHLVLGINVHQQTHLDLMLSGGYY